MNSFLSKITLILITISLYAYSGQAQELSMVTAEDVGMSSDRFERLTEAFQGYVDDKQLAGSVILIARRGEVPYFKAFGRSDVEDDVSMDKNTIFRIASQTKAIVSVGIMMLQENGHLLISDPLSKYIPEFANSTVAKPLEEGGYDIVKANREITLRDLLTHTAGIGYGGGPASDKWQEAGIQGWYFAHRDEPILETVKRMASLPMDAQPGEQFVYGYNTDILGAVIEVVSGQSLDQFLQDNILDPLGMIDTHFYLPESKTDRLATVYSSSPISEDCRVDDRRSPRRCRLPLGSRCRLWFRLLGCRRPRRKRGVRFSR